MYGISKPIVFFAITLKVVYIKLAVNVGVWL